LDKYLQIVFHVGTHWTDESQIRICLLKNQGLLADAGVFVPRIPGFLPILNNALAVHGEEIPSAATQRELLTLITQGQTYNRIVFSSERLIGRPHEIFRGPHIYFGVEEKIRRLRNIFPDCEVEFYFATRNIATLVPTILSRLKKEESARLLKGVEFEKLRWSETITRIQRAIPGVPINVWSNEDTPFIWYDLINRLTNNSANNNLAGMDDFLASIMLKEGIERMTNFLNKHPRISEFQRRSILGVFLDKFEIVDESLKALPVHWTEEYVKKLSNLYEDDLIEIEQMLGTRSISG